MERDKLTEYIIMYINGMIGLSEFRDITRYFDDETLDACNIEAFDTVARDRVMGYYSK